MKRLFPGLSNLLASWASAGQYSSVAELELDQPTESAPSTKVVTLPRYGNASLTGPAAKTTRRRLG